MDKRLRVGIAGFGIVGPRRKAVIDIHPDLKTVAVCDRSFEKDGVFDDGVKYYNHYEKLLSENLDVLFVCMTHDIAPKVTMLGLQKGLHVFCEKPPGRNVQDVKDVMAVEKQHPKSKLKFGFNHRYHESVKEALKIVKSGEMGSVINLRGVYGKSAIKGRDNSWREQRAISGGGILLDQGIHMIDLMISFAGPFSEVKSFVSNSFWEHDVEDNAYAIMRSDAGVIAMLHSTATQWRHRFALELSLTRGSLILSGILSGTKSYGQETLKVVLRGPNDYGNPKEQLSSYIEDNSWKEEVFEFADCILKDEPIKVGSSMDALLAMEQVYKIYTADPGWATKFNIKM